MDSQFVKFLNEFLDKTVPGLISTANESSLGWITASESFAYSSSDDPTYVITTSGDLTAKYQAGMKIRLLDSSLKYFIITKVEFSSPNTIITLYGGTDYDLTGGSISNVSFSTHKAPFGFPGSPEKWTVSLVDTTDRNQSSPSDGTWYNLGSLSIDIPIGVWDINYVANIQSTSTIISGEQYVQTTLSTANNSESNKTYTRDTSINFANITTNSEVRGTHTAKFILDLSTKDTYFLNHRTTGTPTDLDLFGSTNVPTTIKAVCAYL